MQAWFVGKKVGVGTVPAQIRRAKAVVRYLQRHVATRSFKEMTKDLRKYGGVSRMTQTVAALREAGVIAMPYGILPGREGATLPSTLRPSTRIVWETINANPSARVRDLAMAARITTHSANRAIATLCLRRYMWQSGKLWLTDGWESAFKVYIGDYKRWKNIKNGVPCYAQLNVITAAWLDATIWTHLSQLEAVEYHNEQGNTLSAERAKTRAGWLEFARDRAEDAMTNQTAPGFPFLLCHAHVAFPQDTREVADASRTGMLRNARTAVMEMLKHFEVHAGDTGRVGQFRTAMLESVADVDKYLGQFAKNGEVQ